MAARIASFLAFSVIALDVFALSPKLWDGCKVIPFAPNSAEISDEAKVALARMSPDLTALQLGHITVRAWGDTSKPVRKSSLADQRAERIKQYYIDLGVDRKLVFWEGRPAEKRRVPTAPTFAPDGSRMDAFKLVSRLATVQYSGHCRAGYAAVCANIRNECGWE
jgi:hypothetical protein